MDYSAEERFVRSFVVKERQERLLYELTRPKKRYDGLSRFCHTAELLLDKRRILLSGTDLYRQEAFWRFLADHGGPCRILSPDPWLDGQTADAADAVLLAQQSMDAAIILGEHFAVVQSEIMRAGQEKYLLCDEIKKDR
jgi:hypothetical protein